MRPQLRFFLALTLMIGVFVLTEMLFPPIRPEAPPEGEVPTESVEPERQAVPPAVPPGADEEAQEPLVPTEPADEVLDQLVTVETPLYRIVFSSYGGVARSIELLGYESFTRDGPVQLVPPGEEVLRGLWVAGMIGLGIAILGFFL